MLEGETLLSGATRDHHVGPFEVMHSNAGYYVGTLWRSCDRPECQVPDCKDFGPGFVEPNTRETPYGTKQQAEKWLQEILADDHTHTRAGIAAAETPEEQAEKRASLRVFSIDSTVDVVAALQEITDSNSEDFSSDAGDEFESWEDGDTE